MKLRYYGFTQNLLDRLVYADFPKISHVTMTVLTWIGAGLFALYVAISVLLWLVQPIERPINRQKHAAVVVVGDVGHSPRMAFHALSIAECGWRVSFIGYTESEVMDEVRNNPLIDVVPLEKVTRKDGESFLLYAIRRVWTQHLSLYCLLKDLGLVDVVLCQVPPAIPTLAAVRLFTLWAQPGTKLLIDWHNLGYSILAMSHGKLSVSLYRTYEMLFGRIAYLHLCVSVRLGMALRANFGINHKRIIPLFDRPWKSHVITSAAERAKVRADLGEITPNINATWIVTSTSYTPDEDFEMLIQGLADFDKITKKDVEVIVTGKGPLKDAFNQSVSSRRWNKVHIHTAWLSYEQYNSLLAVADLGISLHSSSSGWDLPMKVVDMFSAGLPVVALEFPALKELVNEKNGTTFKHARGLADQLDSVLNSPQKLAKLRAGAIAESKNTWSDSWRPKLGPVFGEGQYTGVEESSSSDSD